MPDFVKQYRAARQNLIERISKDPLYAEIKNLQVATLRRGEDGKTTPRTNDIVTLLERTSVREPGFLDSSEEKLKAIRERLSTATLSNTTPVTKKNLISGIDILLNLLSQEREIKEEELSARQKSEAKAAAQGQKAAKKKEEQIKRRTEQSAKWGEETRKNIKKEVESIAKKKESDLMGQAKELRSSTPQEHLANLEKARNAFNNWLDGMHSRDATLDRFHTEVLKLMPTEIRSGNTGGLGDARKKLGELDIIRKWNESPNALKVYMETARKNLVADPSNTTHQLAVKRGEFIQLLIKTSPEVQAGFRNKIKELYNLAQKAENAASISAKRPDLYVEKEKKALKISGIFGAVGQKLKELDKHLGVRKETPKGPKK